jgi:mannan endo-1,4-beta-mannosidase
MGQPEHGGGQVVKIRLLAVLLAIAAIVGVVLGTHPGVALSPSLASSPVQTFPHHYVGVVSYNVAAFDRGCGCTPNVAVHYLHIGGNGRQDIDVARAILAAGAVPMLELEPYGMSLARISSGSEDTWLAGFAREVAGLHAPIIMSFAPEPNGDWYSWGYPDVAPSAYVSAWRHVVTVFRKAGPRAIKWAWIMNVNFSGSENIRLLWPGQAYVNLLGLDGYVTAPATFAGFFGPTIVSMRAISSDPLLITETAGAPSVGKLHALREITAGVAQYGLVGFIWFDIRQHGNIRRQDWRLEDEPAALTLFARDVKAVR